MSLALQFFWGLCGMEQHFQDGDGVWVFSGSGCCQRFTNSECALDRIQYQDSDFSFLHRDARGMWSYTSKEVAFAFSFFSDDSIR